MGSVPEAANLQTGVSERVVTAEATAAHKAVIATGTAHVDGKDGCGEKGIAWTMPELCPGYLAASALYTAFIQRGQRGAAH